MPDIRVVDFQKEHYRNAAKALRKIAEDIESGEEPDVQTCALVILNSDNQPSIYGFGPRSDELSSLAAFKLGEQALIDVILGERDGS